MKKKFILAAIISLAIYSRLLFRDAIKGTHVDGYYWTVIMQNQGLMFLCFGGLIMLFKTENVKMKLFLRIATWMCFSTVAMSFSTFLPPPFIQYKEVAANIYFQIASSVIAALVIYYFTCIKGKSEKEDIIA